MSFTVQTSMELNTKISFGMEDGLKAKSDATLLKEAKSDDLMQHY
jgi:hypothetical protein